MKKYKKIALKIVIIKMSLLLNFVLTAYAEILFEGDSIYHHITIRQNAKERCMLFGRYLDNRETCINLDEVDFPVLEYTEMMFVGFLIKPETEKIMLIGLGGGYIPTVFKIHLPHIRLKVVELDPMVNRLAEKYFNFKTSLKISLDISDGRMYLKRTKELFDQIWVDAFNSDYIPTHMTTKEFLLLAKSRLAENGIVIENVHSNNKLFDAQVLTFLAVFKHVLVFDGKRSANSIIVASDNSTHEEIIKDIKEKNILKKIGKIDLLKQAHKYKPTPKIRKTQILTDDYSPANLWLHHK